MENKITGDMPVNHVNVRDSDFIHPIVSTGMNIYQEAVLRFMVALAPRWSHPEDCAKEADIYARAYIAELNKNDNGENIC